jgi:hypothetical protein
LRNRKTQTDNKIWLSSLESDLRQNKRGKLDKTMEQWLYQMAQSLIHRIEQLK